MRQQDRYYPRILVINGDALHQGTATATLIASLFAGWPKDRLAQLYSSRCDVFTDEISGKAWRLDGVTDRIPGLSRTALPRPVCSPKAESAVLGHAASTSFVPATARSGRREVRKRIRETIRTVLDLVPYRLSPKLLKEIHTFAPEVIYSCIGNIQLAALVKKSARRERAAIVIHLLDDWLATKHASSWALAWPRRELLRVSRDLINRSAVCMAGSYVMAEEYTAAFGVPFLPFMHCISVPAEPPDEEDPVPLNTLRLVYVGGLHLNRWRSLVEIAGALEELQRESLRAKLHVYAPAKDLEEHGIRLAGPACEIGGSLRPEEIPGILPRAHVLVHVEAFDADTRAYARLSLSTKITQYLSAGRPLFCYGPGEVGSCRYVESTGAGVVVGRQDRSDLVNQLRLMCVDRDLRLKLGRAAWETARRHHDAGAVRERFRAALAQAATGHTPPLQRTALQGL